MKGEIEMEKKCDCEQKQAEKVEGEKIVLELNDFRENICCFLCDNSFLPSGLDFFIEGTQDLVCPSCAKQHALDLFIIREYARKWREKALDETFERGVSSGKTTAGEMILDAIEAPEIERE